MLSEDWQLKGLARIAFAVALFVIVLGSLWPGVASMNFSMHDKVLHLMGYLSLGLLAGLAWPVRRMTFFLVLTLIGFGLEVGQLYVPGRGFDWIDALANALGAYIGVRSAPYFGSKLMKRTL